MTEIAGANYRHLWLFWVSFIEPSTFSVVSPIPISVLIDIDIWVLLQHL